MSLFKKIVRNLINKPAEANEPLEVAKVAEDKTQFAALALRPEILSAVTEEGYVHPTPIQLAAIGDLMKGRDLLGCAQTGTGKTAAFALPTLHTLSSSAPPGRPIRVLVLTPTRELALQVAESYTTYGKYLPLKTAVIFGGVGAEPQKQALRRGIDILVATPGRLLDLHGQGLIQFNKLETLILDEADRMLDMGFLPDVRRIIKLLPPKRQNVLFSATMPKDIQDLSMQILRDPVKVEVTPVSSTSERVEQSIYFVDRQNKRDLLLHILTDPAACRVLVFTRTKAIANRVAQLLNKNNVHAAAIHGNKSQSARQKALEQFKAGKLRVLVASDLAARGLDVDDISHVINFDLPNVAETYVHRIGRTGRAQAEGKAISFCDAEERAYLRDIERTIGKSVPVVRDHPYASTGHRSAPEPQRERHQSRSPQPRGRRPSHRGRRRPKRDSRS